MTALLWTIGGCITDFPEPRPETSDEMIRQLPDAPLSAAPSAAPSAPAGDGAPVEVTMHDLRGTPAGRQVTVSGFLSGVHDGEVHVSADSEGKTLHLLCEGADAAALATITPHTPVRVTGTVGGPEGDDTVVLTSCAAEVAGEAPIDLDRPRRAPPEG